MPKHIRNVDATDPSLACVRTTVPIENISIGPLGHFHLHQASTSNRLLQIVKTVLGVFDFEPLPRLFMRMLMLDMVILFLQLSLIICQVVVAQEHAVIDLADHDLQVDFQFFFYSEASNAKSGERRQTRQ